MRRRAVSIVELLLVIGVLAVVSVFSVPLYQQFQVGADLTRATGEVSAGLVRAKQLAVQTGHSWGYAIHEGVLFRGSTFRLRDAAFDELYPVPFAIVASGPVEVTYSAGTGLPSVTGTIHLQSPDGGTREVQIP